jgi:hypothetical protein
MIESVLLTVGLPVAIMLIYPTEFNRYHNLPISNYGIF